MVKRLFAYILLFLFSVQILSSAGYLIWFKLNQQEITDLFCINKSKPELQCQGKCFMMKGLHHQEQQRQSDKSVYKLQLEETFVTPVEVIIVKHIAEAERGYAITQIQQLSRGFEQGITKPPRG